jgi:PPOX class probable FMN-dependent enzyme
MTDLSTQGANAIAFSSAASTLNWRTLLTAAQTNNPQAHNRFAHLATLQGGDTPRPAVRTVTVRFFLDDGRLLLTTDTRADKVAELAENSACELCWYFTQTREQFRFHARGHVISAPQARLEGKLDEAMQRTWNARSSAAQQSFTWPQPKRRVDDAAAYAKDVPTQVPDHFALLLLDVVTVDYLNLATQPHQRVMFNKLGGQWMPRSVNP